MSRIYTNSAGENHSLRRPPPLRPASSQAGVMRFGDCGRSKSYISYSY